jgi:hypothetical protein
MIGLMVISFTLSSLPYLLLLTGMPPNKASINPKPNHDPVLEREESHVTD